MAANSPTQVLAITTSGPPGFTVTESGGSTTVNEDNAVDSFTVVLDAVRDRDAHEQYFGCRGAQQQDWRGSYELPNMPS